MALDPDLLETIFQIRANQSYRVISGEGSLGVSFVPFVVKSCIFPN